MLKKILSNSFIYGVAPQIIGLVNMLMLPILTPKLTATDYGVYGVINALLSGFAILQFLGLTVEISNAYYYYPNKYSWHWRKILGLLIYWNIPFLLFQNIVLWFVIPNSVGTLKIEILLWTSIPILFSSTFSFIGSIYYHLTLNAKPIFYRTILVGLLVVGMNYYAIVIQNYGFMGWIYANSLGTIMMGLTFVNVFYKLKLHPIFLKWSKLKVLSVKGLKTVPYHFSSYILESSDRILLEWMGVPITQIGRYNLSNSIGNRMFQLSKGYDIALAPLIVKLYQTKNYKRIKNILFSSILFFLLGTIILSIWTKEIFDLLIRNKQLTEIYPIAIFLIMAINYRPLSIVSNAILEYKEETTFLSKLSTIITVINITLNIILIHYFGIKGAAICTLVSYLIYGVWPYLLKNKNIKLISKFQLFMYLILVGVSTCSVLIFVEQEVMHKLTITILLSSIMTIILLSVFRTENK